MTRINAEDLKLVMYYKAFGSCTVCKKTLYYAQAQLAHRIPKTIRYIRKYGRDVIHHPLNMAITCDRCNSSVLMDPKTHPIEAMTLINEIEGELNDSKNC